MFEVATLITKKILLPTSKMSRFEKFKMNLLMDSGTRPKTQTKQTQNYYLLMKRKLVFSYCLFDLVKRKMEILRCIIIKLHLFY